MKENWFQCLQQKKQKQCLEVNMVNNEKKVQNGASTKLKLVQYGIQLIIAKSEHFSKKTVPFLQDNYHDLLHCAFLRKLPGCVRNITVFCQHILRPIKSAIQIGCFGRYWLIRKTQISADISVYL